MRYFALAAFIAIVALAPTRLHAQGIRCRDGTTWVAKKTAVACAGHGGVVGGTRRFRARAAPGAHTRRVILCRDGTTSNATGRTACSRHGGINKGSQTRSAPPIRSSPR